ncbi:hypothetical protein AKJ47_01360 [candidate division MSBL1 archaeon SCGC-AAA261G05]|uniref:Uncharacterized protein n=1 Tax=candidate division MSBL1 archaeon SCGC-AAA261G05 TaxID=1698276 RepID=A0A133VBZ5_9EURY|nr:hypothetical protein AKJ47_01360 [candidate division MSBL1 archaeon SCGC-AAA261G05]
MNTHLNSFFVVLARDGEHVREKIEEIEAYDIPYKVICGEEVDLPNVVYREPKGKWDAVNYSRKVIPKDTDVVVFNDVDTKIRNFHYAVDWLRNGADLVYTKVKVSKGPQIKFYKIMDPIRKRLHMFASGELMLIRREVLEEVLPVPPCLAEDSYILFKALELGYKAEFCDDAYVETERTTSAEEEKDYKTRTTLGIYQALEYANPPFWINLIYKTLPFIAPFLSIFGEDGEAWSEGIQKATHLHELDAQPTKF